MKKTMVTIVKDKDLIWEVENYDVILVGTSVYNMLTNGFQSKIGLKYPILNEVNDKTNYGDMRKLGLRKTIDTNKPILSLMYICKYPHSRKVFLDEDALIQCLSTANIEFKGMRVATTLLGTSPYDGNADRDKMLKIIEECTPDLDLTIYDYVQLKKTDEVNACLNRIRQMKETSPQEYEKLWKNKDNVLKGLFLK